MIKNEELNKLIIDSARKEFIKHGFDHSSLRNLSKDAGLTTGAIYTRFKDKDELFEAVINERLGELSFAKQIENINKLYLEAKNTKDIHKFLEAIDMEEKIFLDFMFNHYEECLLIMCRSEGSRLKKYLNSLMEKKTKETINYIKDITNKDIEYDAIKLIINEQFSYYQSILENGYPKEKALKVMMTVQKFMNEGWKFVFQDINEL